MSKFWCGVKAVFAGLFVFVFVIALIIVAYLGIGFAWDYAVSKFGDAGIGFMVCLSGVIILCYLFGIINMFYKDFTKNLKEEIIFDDEKKTPVKADDYEED